MVLNEKNRVRDGQKLAVVVTNAWKQRLNFLKKQKSNVKLILKFHEMHEHIVIFVTIIDKLQ
tara:strand:+ start:9799 stop:9984 length:186 start_codon:yes stop_codon:yes gene_type:complete